MNEKLCPLLTVAAAIAKDPKASREKLKDFMLCKKGKCGWWDFNRSCCSISSK